MRSVGELLLVAASLPVGVVRYCMCGRMVATDGATVYETHP